MQRATRLDLEGLCRCPLALFVAMALPCVALAQSDAPPPPALPPPPAPAPAAAPADLGSPSDVAPEPSRRLYVDERVSLEGNGVFGSSTWGSRGAYRVLSARPLTAGSVVLSISDEYFSTSAIFTQTDSDQQSTQRMRILWSPLLGLEVGLAQLSTVNKYFDVLPRTFQVQGNPSLLVKYSRSLMPEVGVGGYVNLLVPTSEFGAGLTPGAFVLTAMALGSWQPSRWVEFSANLGFIFDQSQNLFSPPADRQQAFVYEINKLNRLSYGVSAVGDIPLADVVTLGPYLEVTGQYGSDPNSNDNPLRATLGVKGYPTHARSVELSVGADLRLGGAPQGASVYAGIPPWTLFGQITVHLGEGLDKLNVITVTQAGVACQSDGDCHADEVCQKSVCTAVVYKEKEVVKEVATPPATFSLKGGVFDASTGEPISVATVTLSGYDSLLSVDPNNGVFTVWPLTTGTGLIQVKVKAPGYLEAEETVARGAAGEAKEMLFKLKGDNKPQFGTLKGTVKDARTGAPLANARIFIPVLGKRVSTGPEGAFEAEIKVGRYQVLVNAKKYVTQKKELNIKNGDVVILNVDLWSKKRHHR